MPEIDYVQIDEKVDCPICGNQLDNFETKEGPGVMMYIDFRDIDHFHCHCGFCHNLVEFSLSKPVEHDLRKKLSISDYEKKGKLY